jgi:hypothetical protein
MRLYQWKAYKADGNWRCFKNKATAIKFAGSDGLVVNLFNKG